MIVYYHAALEALLAILEHRAALVAIGGLAGRGAPASISSCS